MKHFVKVRIWDYLLCLCCQVGLIFHIFAGFLLEDSVYGNVPLVILMLAALNLVYFAFSYNRILSVVGIAAGIAVVTVFIFWTSVSRIFEDEAAHSLGITLFLIVLVSLAVFLLARGRGGIIVLFIVGTIIDAGAHFLQYETVLWSFLLFEVAVFLLFLYRSYVVTVMNVQTGKVKIPVFITQSLLVCLLAFAIGLGAYYGIVRPMNPPTRELKLITVLEDMDILRVFGVTSEREMLDPDKLTASELARVKYTSEQQEQQPEEQEPEEEKNGEDPASPNDSQNDTTGESSSAFQKVYNIFKEYTAVIVIVLIAIALTLLFLIRWLRKKHWRDQVDRLSPENQVINYYQYFLDRLSKLGYKKPVQHTLYEYAGNLSHEMEAFESEGITFGQLTKVYIETWYGNYPVSEEKAGWFKSFYNSFAKNARKELGFFRYCLKFFII